MSDKEQEPSNFDDLVVIGSSAGGVEALSILVGTLPADFPAPIVIAQHLDPSRPSILDSILQRRTTLSVEVINGSYQLQAGKIYIIPANCHAAINDGHVEVQGDHIKRPRPSVDLLLTSAAQAYGDRLVAVILTGSGSDGAAGAVEVKHAGGTVIAQNPQSARYPSMPLALPPTVVDFEVDIERIGPLLYDLLNGSKMPQTETKTQEVLHSILEQVGRQASVDFRHYKTSTIFRRIGRRMTVTHSRTMRDYLDYLKENPEEVGELVRAFLINVTQFFRDPDAFAYLQQEILPRLIARARDRDHVLRFWTAGCATGEESYSLAMLVTDQLGAELPQWSVKIFATDLNEATINFARRGLYSENLLKSVPKEYSDRFFEQADHGYRISKTLRQMVIFGQQDLSRSAPFPRIDLILCRNVLIYFTPELQDYVLNQFVFSLSPGSYLFLGKAETVRPLQTFYELVNKHWKVYRSKGGALPTTHRMRISELSPPRLDGHTIRHPIRSAGRQVVEQDPPAPTLEVGQLRRFNELLLRFLPLGVVVIDRTYHVLTANGMARRILSLRDLVNEQDFLHAVRGIPYAEVRGAIDMVFRERGAITLPEVELDFSEGGNGHFIFLSIVLMQVEANSPDMAIISILDVTEQVQIRRQLESVQAEQTQLMHELGTTNKRLNDVNKELMDANGELQVANEELVLTHEELQASIEEFETTNEELQATNEELETNNEELQATNEELETTNDELRARTGELQELTVLLESERVRLAEMVELAPFYIMVLRGPKLLVEAFNPRYADLLQGREIQNRPLEIVFELFWEVGMPIVRLAYEAFQSDTAKTTPRLHSRLPKTQGEADEKYIVYHLIPSHDGSGKVSGVVIYSVDETEQRAREIEEEQARIKLIFDNANTAAMALYDAQTSKLIMASPRYLDVVAQAHGFAAHDLIGRKWHDIAFGAAGEAAGTLWSEVIEKCAPIRQPELHWQPLPGKPETIWDWSLTPIVDKEQAAVLFMLVSAVEITEQVQARQEVERLNRLKEDFLSLTGTELRPPLATIMDNIKLLQATTKSPREEESKAGAQQANSVQNTQVVETIMQQALQLNRLIDELADITHIHGGTFELKNKEHINLVTLVQDVVAQSKEHSKHPITLATSQERLLCICDERHIAQALRNLINDVSAQGSPDVPVKVSIQRDTDNAVISVQNKEYLPSKEQQTHIFERFYRLPAANELTINEGLGLGLYIAHEIVTLQGGHMWLETTSQQGSIIYFSLPLEQKASK
jgi:two-component system, chemotaxis family, CheB/CheR fusion protein